MPAAEWTGFHPIEQALWVRGTPRAGMSTLADEARSTTSATLAAPRADDPARAGADRERRGRAARRGVEVEDHRRGGALLAHRPRRLRGERRGLARRRSTRCGRSSPQSDPALADEIDAALRRRATGARAVPARRRLRLLHGPDAGRHAQAVAGRSTRSPSRSRRSARSSSSSARDDRRDDAVSRRRRASAAAAAARRGRRRRARAGRPRHRAAHRRRRGVAAGETIPFYGAHQAGIATPAQDRLHFAAFDVVTDDRSRICATCCATGRQAAARMTAGPARRRRQRRPDAPPARHRRGGRASRRRG